MAVVRLSEKSMSEAEWQTRCDLAALYRLCHHFGWTDLIYTHMTARIPGEPDAFLINHYGEMFDEITASSLIKMDMSGRVLGENANFNKAGFTIHSGVYKARPDVNCVLHTHTRPGTALSLLKRGLRPISQDALEVIDELGYHEYGEPSSQEECEALGRSCAGVNCVVLLNHGLLALGDTIQSAFIRLYFMERSAEVEIAARMLDEPPVPISEEIIAKAKAYKTKQRASGEYGNREWKSMIRMLDRQGVDYRK